MRSRELALFPLQRTAVTNRPHTEAWEVFMVCVEVNFRSLILLFFMQSFIHRHSEIADYKLFVNFMRPNNRRRRPAVQPMGGGWNTQYPPTVNTPPSTKVSSEAPTPPDDDKE